MLFPAARDFESRMHGRGLLTGSFLLQLITARHLESHATLTETEVAQQVMFANTCVQSVSGACMPHRR